MSVPDFHLCVIGCGRYAAEFASKLSAQPGPVRLSFASRDADRAREYCRRFDGVFHFGSYREAAVHRNIEALYVCTPHFLHWEHALEGIANGNHILVEKPIAPTLEDGLAMVTAARDAGVTLMVAENARYLSQVRLCRQLIDDGAVGDLRMIQFDEETDYFPAGWRNYPSHSGGGVFIDAGIHKIHVLRYLAGEPDSVIAMTLPRTMEDLEVEDGIVATLQWPSGVVGLINHVCTSGKPRPPSVRVIGTRGNLIFEVGNGELTLEQRDRTERWALDPDNDGVPLMVQDFVNSIREGREPETSGEEGLRDLAVALVAYGEARADTLLKLFPDPLQPQG